MARLAHVFVGQRYRIPFYSAGPIEEEDPDVRRQVTRSTNEGEGRMPRGIKGSGKAKKTSSSTGRTTKGRGRATTRKTTGTGKKPAAKRAGRKTTRKSAD